MNLENIKSSDLILIDFQSIFQIKDIQKQLKNWLLYQNVALSIHDIHNDIQKQNI